MSSREVVMVLLILAGALAPLAPSSPDLERVIETGPDAEGGTLGEVQESESDSSRLSDSFPPPKVIKRNRNPGDSNGEKLAPAVDCTSSGEPCFFAGEAWNPWFETHHTSVEVSIQTPSHPARTGDFYYVLLSIWDSADSYDQIGFSSSDAWGLTYSHTEPCPTRNEDYHFDSRALDLAEGQRYTFRMTLGGGSLTFSAWSRGVRIWALQVPSTATFFKATDRQYCPTYEAYGYTNFEEIWTLTGPQPVPEWSFYFYDSKLDGAPASSDWGSYYTGSTPSQVVAMVIGDDMVIANHYFTLRMVFGTSFNMFQGMTFTRDGFAELIRDPLDCFITSCVVDLSVTQQPPGWTVTVSPTSGMPTYFFAITFTVPPNAALGVYVVELRATNSPRSQWTHVWIRITVNQGFGGGCVALGTLIRTPTGSVPVETLAVGSQVLSYDLATQSMVVSQLLSSNVSTQSATFVINYFGGSLRLTPTDQPIYFKNDTFTGWLANPQEMHIGDLVFNPMSNLWVVVTEISFVNESITVYSLVPSAAGGTFMANDMLVMRKT